MSRPWPASAAMVKRSASAPNAGMPSGNSLRVAFSIFSAHLRLHQPGGALGDQVVERDAVDDVERVEDVALGLGHLLAVLVADQAGDVDVLERHAAGEVVGHHDHPRDPEEDDVEAGDQHRRRHVAVEAALAPSLAASGQPMRAERPQRRGEPGLEHVVVLRQRDIGAERRASRALRLRRGRRRCCRASSYHAGMRWPHQSWRLMHQSWMFSIQWR